MSRRAAISPPRRPCRWSSLRAAPAWACRLSARPPADPNAVIKPVGPSNTVVPAAEKPAEAPDQVNDIKSGSTPAHGRRRRQAEEAQGRPERRILQQEEKEEGSVQAESVLDGQSIQQQKSRFSTRSGFSNLCQPQLPVLVTGSYKLTEERVRLQRLGFELGMELAA